MTDEIKGQMSIFDFLDQDSWSGKMYPEHSVLTEEKISESSSKRPQKWQKGMPAFLDLRGGRNGRRVDASWEMGGLLLGEYTMHSFGECPKEENVSLLSQILEDRPHPKYSLSARACMGILRRAEKRGKVLPTILKEALERQSLSKNEQVVRGGVKESLSNMNGQEHCQHLTTKACCKAVDMYNQSITGDVTMAITGAATDPHHIPCVIDNGPCISVDEKMGNTYIGENVGNTLSARDFKQPQAVVYGLDRASFNQGQNALYDFSIEEEKAQTLVAKGPGGVLTKLSEHYAQEITKE